MMKTALFLSAASLAAAFVVPGNDQHLLSAFSQDGGAAVTAVGNVASEGGEVHATKEKECHNHGLLSASSGRDDVHGQWNRVAGLADGLQKFLAHFEEEVDPELLVKEHGKKQKHGEHKSNKEKKAKHDEKKKHKKHNKEKKHEGKRHHHKGGKENHDLDVFDIKPCKHHHKPGVFTKTMNKMMHLFGFPISGVEDHQHPHPHSHHHSNNHHHEHNKTIYELISSSNHTKVFTHIINQYDEAVKYLNSTSSHNYTIFVPIDTAFERLHHHHRNFSEEAVRHWLEYHVSPEVFTLHDFFETQTVPTYRHDETESKFPQHISTALTPKGLTLNFHSHVIKPDIFATNGVIHAIDKLLVPAFSAKSTIELVPSIFGTLDLALIKTGLIDELNSSSLTTGGTFFAPTNQAFAKLPVAVNAFLFSPAGTKYLRALLKYHFVPGHIVFTDAYYEAESNNETDIDTDATGLVRKKHYDLPTSLDAKSVSLDIVNFHRFTSIIINKHVTVAVPNVPVKEGVIHLVSSLLVPPHSHKKHSDSETAAADEHEHEHEKGDKHEHKHEHHKHKHDLTIHSLMERLEPFVEQ